MLVCINQSHCAVKSSYDVTTEEFINEYNNTVSNIGFYKSFTLIKTLHWLN